MWRECLNDDPNIGQPRYIRHFQVLRREINRFGNVTDWLISPHFAMVPQMSSKQRRVHDNNGRCMLEFSTEVERR